LFREHDFIIQEAQTTAAGGNLSISGWQREVYFVAISSCSPVTHQSLACISERNTNKFKTITSWNNNSSERFPV
jgi:hypothetical protein